MKYPVIFDIDNTLTAEPYDDSNLLSLKENPTMLSLALSLQKDHPLLISTARPESIRKETKAWLEGKGLKPVGIYMRPNEKEGVPDAEIKLEHLKDIREKHGKPVVWYDDNPSNVRMLKENDVPVIHVK